MNENKDNNYFIMILTFGVVFIILFLSFLLLYSRGEDSVSENSSNYLNQSEKIKEDVSSLIEVEPSLEMYGEFEWINSENNKVSTIKGDLLEFNYSGGATSEIEVIENLFLYYTESMHVFSDAYILGDTEVWYGSIDGKRIKTELISSESLLNIYVEK